MNADLDLACHLNVVVPNVRLDALPAALGVIAETGYRRVVLPPLNPDEIDGGRLGATIAAAGLSPITIAVQGPGADVSSNDRDERARGLESLRRCVEMTRELGGDQMNGVPYGPFGKYVSPPTFDERKWSAEGVGLAADYAHELGIMMTFEVLNRYETAMVNTAQQAIDFVQLSGSQHLRIHLDTFHMGVEESSVDEAIRTALPYLGFLELGQSGRGPLESGVLDIPDIVRQALNDGYRGRWGVEAFSRDGLDPEVADALGIWRMTFDDARTLAGRAQHTVWRGWSASAIGHQAARLKRKSDMSLSTADRFTQRKE